MPNEHNRVGIAGTVYHQVSGHNPTSSSLRGTMHLESDEEAFVRSPSKPLGASWEPLKFGHLPGCSVLCVRNLEPSGGPAIELGRVRPTLTGPSNDRKCESLGLVIPPGMITVLYPGGMKVALRCPGSEAHYSLFAAPE